jgi:hypothetical protein
MVLVGSIDALARTWDNVPKIDKVTLYQEKTTDNKNSTVSDQKNIQKNIAMKCSGVFSTIHTYNVIREMLASINSKAKEASQGNIYD